MYIERYGRVIVRNQLRLMWRQWVNAVLGLWVLAIPFTSLVGGALVWTLAITGIVIAVLGVWGALENMPEVRERRLQHQ